jgi:exodeoxyribonuclease-5
MKEDSELLSASLLVLDEYSMINQPLGVDLESLGVPILLLGDPMQLPPVRGTGYFAKGPPDTMLTEITRQALDSPIIRYATIVREGGSIPFGNDGNAMKVPHNRVTDDMLPRAGQLLCGLNRTRRALNGTMRRELGHSDPLPVKGERLVCLQNDRESGLLNGMVVTALNDAGANIEGEFLISVDNDGVEVPDVAVNSLPFTDPEACGEGWEREGAYPMEYGYALTVHKAQGSQWDRVTVMDDGFAKREPGNRQRWLYTAITRAAEKLVIVA